MADEGTLHFERTYFNHRDIGPNGDSYICPAKTAKLPCPICEARSAEANERSPDKALIKALMFKERQLFWVRDHAEFDKGWQLWDISYHLFGKQLDARIKDSDPDMGFEYFSDPKAGMTMRVGFGSKSFDEGKPFFECRSIDFKARKPIPKAEVQALPCLDDMVILLPYEKLKRVFLQIPDDEPLPSGKKGKAAPAAEAEPWGDDEPAAPAKPAPKKPKPALEPEADADDWGDEPAAPPPKKPKPAPEPEDEAEEAPPAKKPKPKPQPQEDDDWGDEPAAPPAKKPKPAPVEEAEEEEAAPPPKKPKPAPAAAADDSWDDWDEDPAPAKKK